MCFYDDEASGVILSVRLSVCLSEDAIPHRKINFISLLRYTGKE